LRLIESFEFSADAATGLSGNEAMTQAVAEDITGVALPRRPDRSASPADYAAAFAAYAEPFDLTSEDELDWAENQARPAYDITRLDAALIGAAVTLTAAVVAVIKFI
jgi:hypothetical protein